MTFVEVLRSAISDFAGRGYVSQSQLDDWVQRIRQAARQEITPEGRMVDDVSKRMTEVYNRLINRGGILTRHPGVHRFSVENIRGIAQSELSRRIYANAGLIRMNQDRAVEDTVQRFAGWATSVPIGGMKVDKRTLNTTTRGELIKLSRDERRVIIDQSRKLAAAFDRILADSSQAIVAQWHQHPTKQPRETHTERHGKWYLIRGTWAVREDLVRPSRAGYLDDVTRPGEEINCHCTATYYYTLDRIPMALLTKKGLAWLDEERGRRRAA